MFLGRKLQDVKDDFVTFYTNWKDLIQKEKKLLGRITEELISVEYKSDLEKCETHVELATVSLGRNEMKIAFFGGTSHGKSTLINAIIGERLLPSSQEHTTDCFIEIVGYSEHSSAIEVIGQTENDSEEPEWENIDFLNESWSEKTSWSQTVQETALKLGEMASALARSRSPQRVRNELITVKIPVEQCKLLKEDLVLMDCPGLGLSHKSDAWLQERYKGSDMFVLVLGNEGTLSDTDIDALKQLHEKFDIRDLCIANTHWDRAFDSPEQRYFGLPDNLDERTATRHVLCAKLLVEELKLCTAEELEDRIFFVSGLEALLDAMGMSSEIPSSGGDKERKKRKKHFDNLRTQIINTASENGLRKKLTSLSSRSQRYVDIHSACIKVLDTVETKMKELKSELIKDKDRIAAALTATKDGRKFSEFRDKLDLVVSDSVVRMRQAINSSMDELADDIKRFSQVRYSHNRCEAFCQGLLNFITNRVQDHYHPLLDTKFGNHVTEMRSEMTNKARYAYEVWDQNTQKESTNSEISCPSTSRLAEMCSYSYLAHVTKLLINHKGKIGLTFVGGGSIGARLAAMAAVAAGPVAVAGAAGAVLCGSLITVVQYCIDEQTAARAIKETASGAASDWLRTEYAKVCKDKMQSAEHEFLKLLDEHKAELARRMRLIDERVEKLDEFKQETSNLRNQLLQDYIDFEKLADDYMPKY